MERILFRDDQLFRDPVIEDFVIDLALNESVSLALQKAENAAFQIFRKRQNELIEIVDF